MDKPVIELWDIDKLVPYEANAKKHPPEQITKLAIAIKTYGFSSPIVIWTDGSIIAGHGRRLASLELGLKKVPVIVRSDLTKAEADALRLADNRVVSTDYDQALQQEEMRRLLGEDIDLSTLGYDDKELEFITADLGDIDASMFVDDLSEAVETQARENAAAAQATDDVAAPVVDALGFKRVSIGQSRELRELMGRLEAKTGKTGAEALIGFLAANL